MSGRYLLDTNVVIALFANDPAVLERLRDAPEVFLCSIVAGELYYGALKSGRARRNLARLDGFMATNSVLGCGLETARHYGELKNALRQKGQPIPENDIWVAATAVEHDLILVTRDAHFHAVTGLRVEVW